MADARIWIRIETAKIGSDVRKIVRTALGVVLVIVGIIGLILPIMPGWIFLIPGLVILSDHFPGIKRLLEWAREKAKLERTPRR